MITYKMLTELHINVNYYFQKKCEQYWPDKVGKTLTTESGLEVSLDSIIPFADYNIQSMSVKQEVRKIVIISVSNACIFISVCIHVFESCQ